MLLSPLIPLIRDSHFLQSLHCIAVTKTPLKSYSRPRLNFSCHLFLSTFLFYSETRKRLTIKNNHSKTFLFWNFKKTSKQSVWISANNLFINTPKMRAIGIKDQVVFKTEQNQKQPPWRVFSIPPQHLLATASENCSFWCQRWKQTGFYIFQPIQ